MSRFSRRMSLLIAALACVGSLAPAAPAEADKTVTALVAQELELCELAMREFEALERTGPPGKVDDSRVGQWVQRDIQAVSASGLTKAEKLAALETLLKRVKHYEGVAEATYKAARAPHVSVLDSVFHRLEVELAIARIKAQ